MTSLARCTRIVFASKSSLQRSIQATPSFQVFRKIHISPYLLARKFTAKHEWIELNGNVGTVGISKYAQEQLGDVVYAQLPEAGSEFEIDEECGALESVKAASEIFCPVSGTIVESNKKVEDRPALINQSCYEDGWLFKIELSQLDEMDALMDDAAYEEFLKQQEES